MAKMRRLINRNGCDLPYFPRVLGDRAVAGELARGGDVQDNLACPCLRVHVELTQTLVRFAVAGQVGQMPVVVAMAQERVHDGLEKPGLVTAEVVSRDQVKCGAGLRLVLVMPPRSCTSRRFPRPVPAVKPNKKKFSSPAASAISMVRAVARANRQRPVHHKLHVARAAGLVTGGRDLLRDVTGRDELLGD